MANIGFRIYARIERPDRKLVESFADIPVPNIADNMSRTYCMASRIRPLNDSPLLGAAFTVKTRPDDNLMLHKAIDMAAPGDVIVVDAQGSTVSAQTGELMILWAQRRGIAGFVIDGAVRDAASIKKMTIPVYVAGISPKGPYKDGPGEINVPVSCGGIVVNPGDILVGDADGIVVINPAEAPELLEKARATVAKEAGMLAAIRNGTWDRAWVEKSLRDKGCDFIG